MLIMETGGNNRMVTNGNQYAGHDRLPSVSNEVIFPEEELSSQETVTFISSNNPFLLVYL